MASSFASSNDDGWLWSAKKAFIVAVVRAIFNDPNPKSMLLEQRSSLVNEHNSQPTMDVTPEIFTVPSDNNLSEIVGDAIRDMSESPSTLNDVRLAPWVEGEWVIDRPLTTGSGRESPEWGKQNNQKVTYLYLHGGQFL